MSGALAGGLAVLAVVLGGVWVVATRNGSPGPAAAFLAWHAVAASAAVGAQVRADRPPARRGAGRDTGSTVAALSVLAITAAVLVGLWLG